MQKMNRVNCVFGFFFMLISVVSAFPAYSQQAAANPELQQKVAALKQSLAQNQQALHQYTWTEKMETIFKGETKSTKQSQCQYGPDGKVQKTALGAPQPPPEQKRGVKGKVIEKKKGEMKDYMERVASLVGRYAPPEASQMQESLRAGKAALQPSAGVATLVFHDYAKPGDTVSLKFDTASKKIQSYDVNTYLDAPGEVV